MTIKRKNRTKKTKVVVAMSGGVDSSVAAALLKKQKFAVIGVFLKFWKPTLKTTNNNTKHHQLVENVCCNQEALRSARAVAEKLKIPFYVLDASREFKKQVVDYYINEYDSGRTPNPCVMCNKFIKFGWLLKKARALGANYLATGHYACVEKKSASGKLQVNKVMTRGIVDLGLYQAVDKEKDQTYFLWQLGKDQLKHILFPIGDYKKSQVRQLAKKFGLPTAEKKESQNVCFVPKGDNAAFLKYYAKKLIKPGKIVDLNGNILGRHKGLVYYTIGQRHGLKGVQIRNKFKNLKFKIKNLDIRPAYVVRLDIENNNLIVSEKKDLYSKELIAENINWINPHIVKPIKCRAKIRYGHQSENCQIVYPEQSRGVRLPNCLDKIKVIFAKPRRTITPGQSVVFYNGKELLGGGVIR